ncbi:MAG TPA: tRNA lysidine(34) synthetase TilS [Pyrinomonadaceae bacterium]|nr:tRNA lysidine(34) synthetase TilS [Pyrinomonadaceae bacterium]
MRGNEARPKGSGRAGASKAKTRLSAFAGRLLAEWRRLALPTEGARVVIAVSGGADSAALLLACEELVRAGRLKTEIVAAHLDHGLRGAASEEDARWVAELTQGLGVGCVVGRARVGERAEETRDNLEQAARRARYEFLSATARTLSAHAVLTAHTLDDQAETVLLRLLRGSGAEGLGGIPPTRALDAGGPTLLARPLVRWARRADTQAYAKARGVAARVDEMNADERFARVRVRRQLLPLAETFNPRAVEALARTAELLREDASALDTYAASLLREAAADKGPTRRAPRAAPDDTSPAQTDDTSTAPTYGMPPAVVAPSTQTDPEPARVNSCESSPPPLRVEVLASAPPPVRRRALRLWIERGRGDLRRMELAHVEAVERLLEGERGGRVAQLPGGARVERRRGRLLFRAAGAG